VNPIIPLAVEHLDEVAAIEARDGDVRWSRAQFEKELTSEVRRFFVVETPWCQAPLTDGRTLVPGTTVLAYGGYWKAGPEAQITNLVVRRENRRQGIGRRLVEFLLDCARGEACEAATLEVRSRNAAARALYASMGFKVAGTRKSIYKEPTDDAVLMEKKL
jgi:ribosomal-protein-alanine N-acetyltransferase